MSFEIGKIIYPSDCSPDLESLFPDSPLEDLADKVEKGKRRRLTCSDEELDNSFPIHLEKMELEPTDIIPITSPIPPSSTLPVIAVNKRKESDCRTNTREPYSKIVRLSIPTKLLPPKNPPIPPRKLLNLLKEMR